LRDDENLVLEAVRHHGNVLQYAAERLRSDRRTVLAAVASRSSSLEFAGPGMLADKEIVLAAIRSASIFDSYNADLVPASLKGDWEVKAAAEAKRAANIEIRREYEESR
jgi:hypothetical protein